MLQDFKKSYPIACKVIEKSLKKNKIGHAYLIESLNDDILDFAVFFSKKIIGVNADINTRVIKPDGMQIKKTQLIELQKDFANLSLTGSKKVYIIMYAEDLNISAANSILKFLEEPEEGIIAILLTKNQNNVLETIKSRCSLITLPIKNNNLYYSLVLEEDRNIVNESQFEDMIRTSNEVVSLMENNQQFMYLDVYNKLKKYFNNRLEISILLSLVIENYKNVLSDVNEKAKIDKLYKKINCLLELKERIPYNVNTNLFLDKLIISLRGIENE